MQKALQIIQDQNEHHQHFIEQQELKIKESSGTIRPAETNDKNLHKAFLEARHQAIVEQANIDILKGTLISMLGEASSIDGIINVTNKIRKGSINKLKLQTEHPRVYQQYLSTVTGRVKGNLRVNGVQSLAKIDRNLSSKKKKSATVKDIGQAHRKPLENGKTLESERVHLEYLKTLKALAEKTWLVDIWTAKIASAIGHHDGIKGLATWKRNRSLEEKFDCVNFSKEHPNLCQNYLSKEKT